MVRADKYRLQDAWVEWIKKLEDWEWYVHFTFAEPVHPEQADKRFKRFTRDINRALYGRRYGDQGLGVPWVRGIEYQRRDVIHFHGLFGGGVSVLRRLTYMDKWSNENGWARIVPYDGDERAIFYMTKYVFKGGDIDIYIPKNGIQKGLIQ